MNVSILLQRVMLREGAPRGSTHPSEAMSASKIFLRKMLLGPTPDTTVSNPAAMSDVV